MKKKKGTLTGLLVILLITVCIIGLVKHFHIKDFHTIKPQVLYTSGQPRGMDYTRLLYKYHIATIVNIRPVSEHQERNWRNEEINWTRSNGVNYIELPIEKKNQIPDMQTQNRFLEIMSNKDNLPILLHGSGGDKRVALLTAVWLEKSEGCTPEQALETAKKIIDDRKLTSEEADFINLLAK
jgi:protein tyrosine/serine phosphatase